MNGIKTFFLLVCFTSVSFAYNCILKDCSPEENSEEQKCIEEATCTANGTNGCMIERYSGNIISTRHNCSSQPCLPTLYRYDGTDITIDCCFTDECNDDSMESNSVADPAVDECYSVLCTTDNTESCLSNAIVEGKARVCKTPPNGDCLTSISDNGYYTTCTVPDYCYPFEWGSYKVDCCTGDLCNSPTAPSTSIITTATLTYITPNVKECYSIECYTEGCLEDTISGGNAVRCSASLTGYCMSMKTREYSTSGVLYTKEVAECREETANEPSSCSELAEYDVNTGRTIYSQCCLTELCNDGIIKRFPDVDVPNCFSMTCNHTTRCEEAMEKGVFAFCRQTTFGCQMTVTGTTFISTCAQLPCYEINSESVQQDCCYGHLCNTPAYTPPTDSTLKVTTAYRTSTKETVESSTETVVKSSTDISEPDATTTQHTLKYSTETSGPDASTTKHPSESSTGISERDVTTKKDTSGAGSVGQMRYVICYLIMLLLSLVE